MKNVHRTIANDIKHNTNNTHFTTENIIEMLKALL